MNQPRSTHTIYLALGSNLGDRHQHLRAAIALLGADVQIDQLSSVYETEPAYVLDQPRFLNMAVGGQTALEPAALLTALKRIEQELGRTAGRRFGPRVIDLDVLLYDDLIIASSELEIPHSRMHERPFVLVPLAEIAPDLLPPGWDRSIGAAAAAVRGNGDVLVRQGALADN